MQALKKWNEQGSGAWCVPRKDSQGYNEVKALMTGEEKKEKPKKPKKPKKEKKEKAQTIRVEPETKIKIAEEKKDKPGAITASGSDLTIDMFVGVANLRDAIADYHSNMSQPIGYLKKLNRAQLEEDIKTNRIPLIELKKYYNVKYGIPLPPKRIYTPYIESVPANIRRRF